MGSGGEEEEEGDTTDMARAASEGVSTADPIREYLKEMAPFHRLPQEEESDPARRKSEGDRRAAGWWRPTCAWWCHCQTIYRAGE